MSDQASLNLTNNKTGPVECLGQTFSSEEVRREHYLKLLAAKLKDPAFRRIEGFPLGSDEAILALSDPPYYTACPNPWLGEFIKHYGTAYEPKKPYHREPFATDVSEGKNHPIYNAHSYHTKVPHRAIMRYILHYTQPGDVVFDGFCGTGMTGVAAQLCGDRNEVQALGYRVLDNGTILNEEGRAFSELGTRRAVLNDLSPAATFIAYNYNNPIKDTECFDKEARRILREVVGECSWMYETKHSDGSLGTINCTLWSDVFICQECGKDVVYWDAAVDEKEGKVNDSFCCSHCSAIMNKRDSLPKEIKRFDPDLGKIVQLRKQIPVLISYTANGKRHKKRPDSEDLAIIDKIENERIPYWIPTDRMMHASDDVEKWGDRWRAGSAAFTHVHHLYTKRNLWILSAINQRTENSRTRFLLSGILNRSTRMNRIHLKYFFFGGGGWNAGYLKGVLYTPSLPIETSIFEQWEDRLSSALMAFNSFPANTTRQCITTQSTTDINLPRESFDYLFIDPPFGANLNYAELSFLWESWLKTWTNIKNEAIESEFQEKGLEEYRRLMTECFKTAYTLLKPGRWMTVEFSNTNASVWNGIQTALVEAGFVVANVSALDKKQGSFNAVTNTTSVKQDLVISAYKPNGGLEARFAKSLNTREGVWDFIKTHLKNLPVTKAKGGQMEFITERDPRILYDRMVAFYVSHSTPVPLSSGEFQADLQDQFPIRDGMAFLPEQVNIYDAKRVQMESIGQLAIFVEDERSAIEWVRQFLKDRPSTTADITPDFMQQLSASWKKWEARPELRVLLDQNFLCYNGVGEVPSQIHSYLSTQFKELRNLEKDHSQLRQKAKDRWYMPDPKKNIDVETLRNKRLLEEFWLYLPEGYLSAARNPDKAPALPGLAAATPRPKVPRSKKLREVRTEAIRVGFKHCYQLKDYATILAVADMLPESVLNEDEQLQMLYDNAALRSGATT